MSKQIVPANLTMPAHLAKRLNAPSSLSSSIGAGLASGGGGYPRISLKGSRFRIIEGGAEMVLPDTELDVIIVGANPAVTKTWYEKQWSKDDEPASPDCMSTDGMRPDVGVAKPQADTCAACPQNQWGSKIAPNGQKIKACADQKRLAVVAANDPSGPIYLLNVTPAALRGLNQYHKTLESKGIPAEVVCTKLSFDTEASFPKLDFSFARFLDAGELEVVDGLFGSPQVYEVTGEKPIVAGLIEVAKPVLVKAAPVKPVEVVVEPEPTPEPAQPKRGFGAKKEAAAEPKAEPKRGFVSKKEPPAAVVATSDNLTDEISNLLASMKSDDATDD